MVDTLTQLFPLVFFGTVICLAVAEILVPGHAPRAPMSGRWVTNIGLFLLGTVLQAVFLPVSALAVAYAALRSGHGALQLAGIDGWLAVLLGMLLLDLWKYVEHRLSHGIVLLWRLHMVHHSDVDADFTTTERHHPIEIAVGIACFYAVIYAVGIPPLAVAIYLLLASAVALFSHANVRLPHRAERWLRGWIVTPVFHGVHHSAARHETDSNFGMLLTVWDRLFGTYRETTPAEDATRVIGLEYFRDARSSRFDRVLCMPFLSIGVRRQTVTDAP